MREDLKAVAVIVWLGLTVATAAAVLAPFVLGEDTIARLAPVCESKRLYGRECVLCGTTTGFIAISNGDVRGAAESNALSIPLFVLFSANGTAAFAYLITRVRRRFR